MAGDGGITARSLGASEFKFRNGAVPEGATWAVWPVTERSPGGRPLEPSKNEDSGPTLPRWAERLVILSATAGSGRCCLRDHRRKPRRFYRIQSREAPAVLIRVARPGLGKAPGLARPRVCRGQGLLTPPTASGPYSGAGSRPIPEHRPSSPRWETCLYVNGPALSVRPPASGATSSRIAASTALKRVAGHRHCAMTSVPIATSLPSPSPAPSSDSTHDRLRRPLIRARAFAPRPPPNAAGCTRRRHFAVPAARTPGRGPGRPPMPGPAPASARHRPPARTSPCPRRREHTGAEPAAPAHTRPLPCPRRPAPHAAGTRRVRRRARPTLFPGAGRRRPGRGTATAAPAAADGRLPKDGDVRAGDGS